ncbi:MAG: hypothetical protein PHH70_03500 [Candidatus Gracilibacteria bacterium]|nr:hypothetical protein [Candidatus Gracilibacteria bacterium]
MPSDNLKKAGFSFEEIKSIQQGRKDVAQGKIFSHQDVMSYARKELFSHAKAHV